MIGDRQHRGADDGPVRQLPLPETPRLLLQRAGITPSRTTPDHSQVDIFHVLYKSVNFDMLGVRYTPVNFGEEQGPGSANGDQQKSGQVANPDFSKEVCNKLLDFCSNEQAPFPATCGYNGGTSPPRNRFLPGPTVGLCLGPYGGPVG